MHLALAFAQVIQARGPLFFGSESSIMPDMLHKLTSDLIYATRAVSMRVLDGCKP